MCEAFLHNCFLKKLLIFRNFLEFIGTDVAVELNLNIIYGKSCARRSVLVAL